MLAATTPHLFLVKPAYSLLCLSYCEPQRRVRIWQTLRYTELQQPALAISRPLPQLRPAARVPGNGASPYRYLAPPNPHGGRFTGLLDHEHLLGGRGFCTSHLHSSGRGLLIPHHRRDDRLSERSGNALQVTALLFRHGAGAQRVRPGPAALG